MLQDLIKYQFGEQFLNENMDLVLEANNIFKQLPEVIKEHVSANLDDFLVIGDVKSTYNNIKIFTESAVETMLDNLSKMISGDIIIDNDNDIF